MFPSFIGILVSVDIDNEASNTVRVFLISDIQSWWEVPSIAHFCSLFRAAFNLLDFDIEELEEALLTDGSEEDAPGALLPELIVRLLSGCLPANSSDVTTHNYQMYLRRLFRQKCQEQDRYNPFNSDIGFQFLPLRCKVQALHALCDFRLEADDVLDLFKNLAPESLRVEPLGYDDNESAYWYFYGTRLYREDFIKSPSKSNSGYKKKKKVKVEQESNESVWQVICFSEADWVGLAERFRESNSRVERALFRSLSENFLPEIPRLFQEKERQQRKRLFEHQPRRTSSRVQEQKVKDEQVYKEEGNKEKVDEMVSMQEIKRQKREARVKDRDDRKRQTDNEEETTKSEEKSEKKSLRSRQKEVNRSRSRSAGSCSAEEGLNMAPTATTKNKPKVTGRQTNNSLASATGQILIQNSVAPVKKKVRETIIFKQTDEDLLTGMYKIVESLKNHDDAWPFVDPVEEEYAPNYYSIIRRPMDLQRMEDKLDAGEYEKFSEFKGDFQLIVNNCRLYNGQDNEYTEMVDNLQEAFNRATDRFLEQNSSDEENMEFSVICAKSGNLVKEKKKVLDEIVRENSNLKEKNFKKDKDVLKEKKKEKLKKEKCKDETPRKERKHMSVTPDRVPKRKRSPSPSPDHRKRHRQSSSPEQPKEAQKSKHKSHSKHKLVKVESDKNTESKSKLIEKHSMKSKGNKSKKQTKASSQDRESNSSFGSGDRNSKSERKLHDKLMKSPAKSNRPNSNSSDESPNTNHLKNKSKTVTEITTKNKQALSKSSVEVEIRKSKLDQKNYTREIHHSKRKKHKKMKTSYDSPDRSINSQNSRRSQISEMSSRSRSASPLLIYSDESDLDYEFAKSTSKMNKEPPKNLNVDQPEKYVVGSKNKDKDRKEKWREKSAAEAKDKFDKIKEQNLDKELNKKPSDIFESVSEKGNIKDKKLKPIKNMSEQEKNLKLKETIEKLRAKNDKSKEQRSYLFDDMLGEKMEIQPLNNVLKDEYEFIDEFDNTDISKQKKNKKGVNKKIKTTKKGVQKAMEALDAETEQTIRDFNKWLDDPPKCAEFGSTIVAPSNIADADKHRLEIDNKASKLDKTNPLKKDGKDASMKRPRLPKDPVKNMLNRKREVQRTIDRLQPGKSKGNLITKTNIQGPKVPEDIFPLGNSAKVKEVKNSLVVETSETGPKLSLGSVLATEGFGLIQQHNFVDDKSKIEAKLDIAPPEEETLPEDDKKVEVIEEVKLTEVIEEIKEEESPKKVVSQEKATPNLSAWFKAFGAPKGPQKKKSEESDELQTENPVQLLEAKETEEKKVDKSAEVLNESPENRVNPDSPMSRTTPIPRTRKASTGSTVSERSNFSQDMDSPRIGIDERLGSYPLPYPSPLHRSPIAQSPIMASPKPDEIQKNASYPNGAIKVGFYNDTNTKSSPDKSCSPQSQALSPSSYPQFPYVYTEPNTSGNTNPNPYPFPGYPGYEKTGLPTYGQANPPPYYDTTKVYDYKPPRSQDNSDYTSMSPNNSVKAFSQPNSPYNQPNSPYNHLNSTQPNMPYAQPNVASFSSQALNVNHVSAGPNSPFSISNHSSPYSNTDVNSPYSTPQPNSPFPQQQNQHFPQGGQNATAVQSISQSEKSNAFPVKKRGYNEVALSPDESVTQPPSSPLDATPKVQQITQPDIYANRNLELGLLSGQQINMGSNQQSSNDQQIPENQHHQYVHSPSPTTMNKLNAEQKPSEYPEKMTNMGYSKPDVSATQNQYTKTKNARPEAAVDLINMGYPKSDEVKKESSKVDMINMGYNSKPEVKAADTQKLVDMVNMGYPKIDTPTTSAPGSNPLEILTNKQSLDLLSMGYSKPHLGLPIGKPMDISTSKAFDMFNMAATMGFSRAGLGLHGTKPTDIFNMNFPRSHELPTQSGDITSKPLDVFAYQRPTLPSPQSKSGGLNIGFIQQKPAHIQVPQTTAGNKAADMINMGYNRPDINKQIYNAPSPALTSHSSTASVQKPIDVSHLFAGKNIDTGKIGNMGYAHSKPVDTPNISSTEKSKLENTSTLSANQHSQANKRQSASNQQHIDLMSFQSRGLNISGMELNIPQSRADIRIPNPRTSEVDSRVPQSAHMVLNMNQSQNIQQNPPSRNYDMGLNIPRAQTSFNSASPTLMDPSLRNLASLSQMMDRYQGEEQQRLLLQSQSVGYFDKSISNAHGLCNQNIHIVSTAANLQMFSQPAMSMAYDRSASNAAVSYQRNATELQQQNITKPTAAVAPVTEVKKTRGRKKKTATPLPVDTQPNTQSQGFQSYGCSKPTTTEALPISLKTASVVPGSAFNFGPSPTGLGLSTSIYGTSEKDYNFLEDYRGSANSYYLTHRATPEQDKTTRTTQPSQSAAYQFLGAPSSRTSSYPFMATPQGPVVDPNSPLYQQMYQRHHEEMLRQSGAQMILNQSLLGGPSGYPPGYHPALGMRQPYDPMNPRPAWM